MWSKWRWLSRAVARMGVPSARTSLWSTSPSATQPGAEVDDQRLVAVDLDDEARGVPPVAPIAVARTRARSPHPVERDVHRCHDTPTAGNRRLGIEEPGGPAAGPTTSTTEFLARSAPPVRAATRRPAGRSNGRSPRRPVPTATRPDRSGSSGQPQAPGSASAGRRRHGAARPTAGPGPVGPTRRTGSGAAPVGLRRHGSPASRPRPRTPPGALAAQRAVRAVGPGAVHTVAPRSNTVWLNSHERPAGTSRSPSRHGLAHRQSGPRTRHVPERATALVSTAATSSPNANERTARAV